MLKFHEMLDEKFRKEPSLDERVKAYFIKGLSQQKKKIFGSMSQIITNQASYRNRGQVGKALSNCTI